MRARSYRSSLLSFAGTSSCNSFMDILAYTSP